MEQVNPQDVALLAEGVDRNMRSHKLLHTISPVALLAEGVDRNTFYLGDKLYRVSRPPRGGRG